MSTEISSEGLDSGILLCLPGYDSMNRHGRNAQREEGGWNGRGGVFIKVSTADGVSNDRSARQTHQCGRINDKPHQTFMRYSAESGIYLGVRRLETIFVAKRRLKRGVRLDGKVDRMVDRCACGEVAVESALTLSPGMTAVAPGGVID